MIFIQQKKIKQCTETCSNLAPLRLELVINKQATVLSRVLNTFPPDVKMDFNYQCILHQ